MSDADTLSTQPRPARLDYTRLFRGSLHELLHPPSGQLPFLHGLRCIAVLLVINHHFSESFATEHGSNIYARLPFVLNGWAGVDLFFVLSGFFIGSQLWKQLARENTIAIRDFILRRGLRIWPLYFFVYLVVLLFWPGASAHQYGWTDLVFLTNYLNHGIVIGGWSLCTEEQFYILTPLALFFFARRISFRAYRVALWGLLAGVALFRTVFWIHLTGSFFAHSEALFPKLYYPFHTHCDGLIVGLILSNLVVSRQARLQRRTRDISLLIASLAALGALRQFQHEIFIFSGLALFFGALTWYGVSSATTLFSSRIFYWISRLSFGMYLNGQYLQGIVLRRVVPHLPHIGSRMVGTQLIATCVLVLLSATASLLTFMLVEHPFLQLRTHLLDRSRAS